MSSFLEHPAESDGLIEVCHSIQKLRGSKTLSLGNVDHLIIDPHGSLTIPPIPGLEEFLSRHKEENLRRYLAVERDLGVPELRDTLMNLIPNTLGVSFNVNRGLIDPNRTTAFALRNIVQRSPVEVRQELLVRHARSLAAVDTIIAGLKPGVKITLLHSTEPFNDAGHSVHKLDLSDPNSLDLFLAARTNVGLGRGPVISICFITGKDDRSTRDDSMFRRVLQRHLVVRGLAYKEDDPYLTKKGKHKTSDYMRARPGDVNTVDWPRYLLATGEISEGSFSLTESRADMQKVLSIARLFAASLQETIARALI